MQTKLTLRLDDALIQRAKEHARQRGTSLSKMVAGFFELLADDDAAGEEALSPTVLQLLGAWSEAGGDEANYRRYLEEKHR